MYQYWTVSINKYWIYYGQGKIKSFKALEKNKMIQDGNGLQGKYPVSAKLWSRKTRKTWFEVKAFFRKLN